MFFSKDNGIEAQKECYDDRALAEIIGEIGAEGVAAWGRWGT